MFIAYNTPEKEDEDENHNQIGSVVPTAANKTRSSGLTFPVSFF